MTVGVRDRRLDGNRVVVDGPDRPVAEAGRGDREHARAAADVQQRAALAAGEQLDAELGRRVGAGAERAAGIDHDGELARVGLLPRRPDPEPAGAHRMMERAPAVLPALLHRRHVGAGERLQQTRHGIVLDVERHRERAGGLALLEAAGRELERDRTRAPPPARAAVDAETRTRRPSRQLESVDLVPAGAPDLEQPDLLAP